MESVADRTETHAVVDNNIQASSKDISVQLSTLLPLTIECAIGLIVGGALQMQRLLLLSMLLHSTLRHDVFHARTPIVGLTEKHNNYRRILLKNVDRGNINLN